MIEFAGMERWMFVREMMLEMMFLLAGSCPLYIVQGIANTFNVFLTIIVRRMRSCGIFLC